jgi:subtilisin family serine protease
MRGEDLKRQELVSRLPKQPTHMAVSPHGLVAVLQEGEVFFLQREMDPIRYTRNRFLDPIDLAFSSWDTLEVLDGVRNTLVTITFRRQTNGEIVFEDERSLPAPEEGAARRWVGMAIYQGLVYLADQEAVYAYLPADGQLVPVALRAEKQDPIRHMALTDRHLYLLHADHIRRYPRAQAVDLALEGGPFESQRALLAFYRYLYQSGLLLTRTVRVRAAAPLEQVLFDNRVLVTPVTHPPDRVARAMARDRKAERVWTEEQAFMEIFCGLNPQACASAAGKPSLRMPIARGSTLQIPRVEMLSRLSRESVQLNGLSVRDHATWRVPSEDLRKEAVSLLEKLNPRWTEKDMSGRTSGAASVPVEHWTVIAAVPVPDYRDRSSALWTFARAYPGAHVYGREGFAAQKALSLQPPPSPPPADPCQTLKDARGALAAAIQYPADYAPLREDAPRIGILEKATTVKPSHQVFCVDQQAPSWHQAGVVELVANPDPATYSATSQTLSGAATFSVEAHHGTHVAGLIAGRQTGCWSGLLPSARLLLVDLTDTGRVRRQIADAVAVDVRVFNVSQSLPLPQQALRDTIQQFQDRALFVAAAGPPPGGTGRVLNNTDDVPAPAVWGQWPNVITVTGTSAAGQILGQLNRGRRYVDLAALGDQVYSASEPPGTYGPATGSSQAAPQVAAAAAMLVDPEGEAKLQPGDAKARLIATAEWDWTGTYDQDLWGGRLDFAAAVRYPQRNMLVTTTGAERDKQYAIVLKNDPTIKLVNAPNYFEREGAGTVARDSIKFTRILSLRREPLRPDGSGGRFRVVLREPQTERLKIVLDAELASDDKIKCRTAEVFNPDRQAFDPDPEVCRDGITIDQVEEYFRGGPYQISWR